MVGVDDVEDPLSLVEAIDGERVCGDWSAIDESKCSIDVVVDVSRSSRNPELPEEGFFEHCLLEGVRVRFVDVPCDSVFPSENVGFVLDGPELALEACDFHSFAVCGNEDRGKHPRLVVQEVLT